MFNYLSLRLLRLLFSLLCVGFTLYRVQVSISTYAEDNSVTSIEHKEFLSEPGYTYPALTLCLDKPGDAKENQDVVLYKDLTGRKSDSLQEESINLTLLIYEDQINISSSFSYDYNNDENPEDAEFVGNEYLQDPDYWCFTKVLKPKFKVLMKINEAIL